MHNLARRSDRNLVLRIAGLLILVAYSLSSEAAVYTWTDSKGITHYSDQASARGARPADLRVRALGSGRDAATAAASPSSTESSTTTLARTHAPRIVSPTPDALIDNARAEVAISVALGDDDTLAPRETLVYRLDGQVLDKAPPTATRLAIDHLGPGRHQVEVMLQQDGHDTGRHDSVTFSVALPGASSTQSAQGPPS